MTDIDPDVPLVAPMGATPQAELMLVLIRLVEAWHNGELAWNGEDPEELLALIARAESAFDWAGL